ncbi:nucleoside recognition domain-containing protein [Halalkalibacter urbisdiaboli]|uniref:nucleoside recognition domain-containing protein n=1 Tax=Halalkalibacter urbisdiaboli TaxID=1960589 RepID=UPI000B44DC13|nr:nucleoside recognition domain-containing protein [Halalkalibacter urbisdiaboli]
MGIMKRGLRVGVQTTWTLGKIIFPITLIITILGYTPLLGMLANGLAPFMGAIGLPGEAAIPLVLGNVLNLYAGIGAILTLDLTVKEVFILAVMLSFSHNVFVESAVAAKLGIRMSIVLIVRFGLALSSALAIHLLWSGGQERAEYGLVATGQEPVSGWLAIVGKGFETAAFGILQMAAIVIPLMVIVQWMKEKNGLNRLSNWMAPFTRLLGIDKNTSTTLASGLTIGLAFGAGVMIQAAKEDGVKKKDLYLVFIFLVACHAVVEDTLIFIPLGIPVWPLLLIRLTTAILLTMVIAAVWKQMERNNLLKRKESTYEH